MAKKDVEWKRLGKGDVPTQDPDKGLGHIVSQEVYLAVFLSLIALTFLTVWTASLHLGEFEIIVALSIATVKAGIVTLIFMHLNYESKLIWGIVAYPVIIFVLMFLGTLGDEMVKDKPLPMIYSNVELAE